MIKSMAEKIIHPVTDRQHDQLSPSLSLASRQQIDLTIPPNVLARADKVIK
jgi:hypothetical protein